MAPGVRFDFVKMTTAADETKNDVIPRGQLPCGFEQTIERMARAVIAGIHHNELVAQPVISSKRQTRIGIEVDLMILGPGRQDHHFF